MSIRNQHVRQESRYTEVKVGDAIVHIYPATWQVDRAKRQYVARKLKDGKLEIPANPQIFYGIINVYATIDNKVVAEEMA